MNSAGRGETVTPSIVGEAVGVVGERAGHRLGAAQRDGELDAVLAQVVGGEREASQRSLIVDRHRLTSDGGGDEVAGQCEVEMGHRGASRRSDLELQCPHSVHGGVAEDGDLGRVDVDRRGGGLDDVEVLVEVVAG